NAAQGLLGEPIDRAERAWAGARGRCLVAVARVSGRKSGCLLVAPMAAGRARTLAGAQRLLVAIWPNERNVLLRHPSSCVAEPEPAHPTADVLGLVLGCLPNGGIQESGRLAWAGIRSRCGPFVRAHLVCFGDSPQRRPANDASAVHAGSRGGAVRAVLAAPGK